ncbi:MAG TPA: hypothetical protein DER68_04645 [Ruminococcaceae bacterium]|nr:hypothetical protein [Oscillospiraceae bacterium]
MSFSLLNFPVQQSKTRFANLISAEKYTIVEKIAAYFHTNANFPTGATNRQARKFDRIKPL